MTGVDGASGAVVFAGDVVTFLAEEHSRAAEAGRSSAEIDRSDGEADARVVARGLAGTSSGRLALSAELLELSALGRDAAALFAVAWLEQDFRDDAAQSASHASAIEFTNRTIVVRIQIVCLGLATAFFARSLLPLGDLPPRGSDAILYALLALVLAAFATVIARNEQSRAASWARRALGMRDAVETLVGLRQQIYDSRRTGTMD